MNELKCKCGNNSFIVINRLSCDDCKHNGVRKNGKYIFPEKTDEERTSCSDDGECEIDCNFNNGCYMFTCSKCNKLHDILPLYSE